MADTNGFNGLLDELIDMQKDIQAIQNPLGTVLGALAGEPAEEKTFNPADYKEKPRANTISCMTCQTRDPSACSRCIDICPTHSITIEDGSFEIDENCRKCGLCMSVCPTEALTSVSYGARKLYDKLLSAALAHEQCYVTCTRALRRLPEDNEVVLPCVGLIPPELWFSLLVEAPNISVFLPYGICEKCRNAQGEGVFVNAIGMAEEWSGRGVGLEEEDEALDHAKRREWERREFMNSVARQAQGLLGPAGKAVSSVQAVAARLNAHKKQLDALTNTLSKTRGTNSSNRRRVMTGRRSIMLEALQQAPDLAENIDIALPICDPGLCTLCGECVKACPVHAIDLEGDQHFSAEATYCVGCGLCARVCEEGAIEMEVFDATDLVVVSETNQSDREAQKAQREELKRMREEAKAKLSAAADFLETLDTSEE